MARRRKKAKQHAEDNSALELFNDTTTSIDEPQGDEVVVSENDDSKMVTPARTEQRICFGLMWFMTAREAAIAHNVVRKQGRFVSGGYFDGMPCGRAPEWDYEDEDGNKFYAVTN